MKSIEVVLSPALFEHRITFDDYIVVVIDVLRATTAFCAAFDSGLETLIPVSGLDELLEFKNNGYLTAYSTTNGTKAVEMAKSSGNIAIAAFTNLHAISKWLTGQNKNIVILCSGWKNSFSLEDTLCAGALVESLELTKQFAHVCDASEMALKLWKSSEDQLQEFVQKANHYHRLVKLGQLEDLKHCFRLNTSHAVPVWNGEGFVNFSKVKI